MTRQNKHIKGTFIGETEYKIADDIEITLEGDKNSFEETVKTINTFGKASGLFLNAGKISAIWLGNKRNSPVKYMPHLQMEWNPPKFKIFGIWFTNDLKECEVLNFSDKFSEIRARKQDRISRKIAVRSIAKRGLGIPNIKTSINAVKLIWIRKLKTGEHKWKSIIKSTYPKVAWFEQLRSSLHFQEHEVNNFWSQVFMAYKEFSKEIHVNNSEELVAEPIFCNQNILVGNIFFFIFDKSVRHIKNIL